MSGRDHGHRHDPGTRGFLDNLRSGDHSVLERLGLVFRNLARRGRPGHPHDCCGNYGEPGC